MQRSRRIASRLVDSGTAASRQRRCGFELHEGNECLIDVRGKDDSSAVLPLVSLD
jgi:hypothetical protein